MCTVSWCRTSDGYQLLCNRDERRTRKPALTPFIQERRGVRFIAPIDVDHGGSWIAVNQFGLAFCLLNRYGCSRCHAPRSTTSRGVLVIEMVDCNSLDQVNERITQRELQHFQPFDLVVLEPRRPSLLIHWTGRDSLVEHDGEYAMPLISSSFDQAGVNTYRKRLFDALAAKRGGVDAAVLHDFHGSHAPVPSAYSPCMHREDASTVSFSCIQVTDRSIEFSYLPLSPCLSQASKTHLTCLRSGLVESLPRDNQGERGEPWGQLSICDCGLRIEKRMVEISRGKSCVWLDCISADPTAQVFGLSNRKSAIRNRQLKGPRLAALTVSTRA